MARTTSRSSLAAVTSSDVAAIAFGNSSLDLFCHLAQIARDYGKGQASPTISRKVADEFAIVGFGTQFPKCQAKLIHNRPFDAVTASFAVVLSHQ